MNEYFVNNLGILLSRVGSSKRYRMSGTPKVASVGDARLERGVDGWHLRLYTARRRTMFYEAFKSGEDPVGEYVQSAKSSYNKEIGMSRITVGTPPAGMTTADKPAESTCNPGGAVTPDMPASAVASLLETGRRNLWPKEGAKWPNVVSAMQALSRVAISRIDSPPPWKHGRGIVIVGGGKYFESAYVTARVVRHVGCQLPIQIWHLPGEVDQVQLDSFSTIPDVELVCAGEVAKEHQMRVVGGWQLKSYSMIHCPFREVLFLDADAYPTRNPEFLFDDERFKTAGAIFWPDNKVDDLKPDTWVALGLDPRDEPAFESGQMLVDTVRHWREMSLAEWMNQFSDFYYQWMYGDKDTFHLAFRIFGTKYEMPKPRPSWVAHTYQHADLDGELIFQHRCRDKFSLAPDKLDTKHFTTTSQHGSSNIYCADLALERECFSFLDDLRGLVTPLPPDPERDRKISDQVSTQQKFLHVIVNGKVRDLDLTQDGLVYGGDLEELTWSVSNGRLQIVGRNGVSAEMKPSIDGSFRGYSSGRRRRPVLLLPR
jgi:hypothetical protein